MCFTAEEEEAARSYRYNGKDDSILCKLFYRKFWDYLIQFWPKTIAPNLITFIGFLFEVVSFAVSFVLSDGLKKPIPRWAAALNGICLFIYQTLDNLDGRQARRTGTSSALGQFFDHGCDAITGVSELLKVAASFNLGCSAETFYFVFLMGIGFFLTSWEEYSTHAFYLGYVNGPDEGLTLLWMAQIGVAIFPALRNIVELPIIPLIFIVSVSLTVLEIIVNVMKQSIKDKEIRYRAGIALIPSIISMGLSLCCVYSRPENVKSPFFIMGCSYGLTYMSQLIIVSFLTHRPPWRLFDWTLFVLWAMQGASILIPSLAEDHRYWLCFCSVTLLFMLIFDLRVVSGLCRALGIRAFSIKKKD